MADRIFIGKKDGNQLLRISKPGFDVNDKSNPMIFSSENNYLKIHHRNKLKLNRRHFEDSTEWYGSEEFPELSYYPLVWYSFNSPQLDDGSTEFPNVSVEIWDAGCAVTMNKVWFSGSFWRSPSVDVYVNFVVFNIKME